MKLCAAVSSAASAEQTETSAREERSPALSSAGSKNTRVCFMLGVFLSDWARMEAPSQSVCQTHSALLMDLVCTPHMSCFIRLVVLQQGGPLRHSAESNSGAEMGY
ncbi:uncharacterized [Tachysurus ichikawai]